jgi:glycosyltransferase involved in cell wall biosynthesis
MRVLNICGILPMEGLKRENDFAIKIQDEINKIDESIEFIFLKNIPYSNYLLGKVHEKWKKYHEYIKKKEIEVGGYRTIIYPWFFIPTSSFSVNKNLVVLNRLLSIRNIEKLLGNQVKEFDLIISQNNISDGVVGYYLSKKYNVPHIHTLRGELNDEIYVSKIFQKIINNASKCITPSPKIYHMMKDKKHDICHIPHGVDKEFFLDSKKDFSNARFITVARLLKLKNIDLVLRALKKAKENGLNFEYSIVGEGPEKENLINMCHKLGLESSVTFYGFLDKNDVIAQLKKHNIMIMPSYPETFGRVYIEAAAAGLLCIGHKGSGVEGFFEDRRDALFCESSTIEEMIIELIRDINTQKIQNYISSARGLADGLQWEEIGHRYINLFNKVLANRH